MIQPIVIDKPSLLVVGHEASFIHALSPDANNLEVIGKLWDGFLHPSREIQGRVGREMFGIIYARPESERSHPDELQYIAAVAVESIGELPAGMISRTVPGATFAVVTHRGPISGIGETVGELYGTWLANSGYQHSGIADIEVYGERFNPTSENSEMQYWISIRPKR